MTASALAELPARLDGEALARLGSRLVTGGSALGEASAALAALPAWSGAAGAAFAAEAQRQQRACAEAGRAQRAAGRAVLRHALVVVAVRARAQQHVVELAAAEHRTRAWAAGPAGAGGAAGHPALPDPGAASRAAATAALARLAREVEESGRTAAAAVRAATAAAPPAPGVDDLLLDRVRSDAASLGTGALEQVLGVLALGVAAAALPARLRAGDPGPRRALGAAARAVAEDPLGAAAALLDAGTWRSDPARAVGHLLPDLLVALATGGLGAGSGAARRAGSAGAGGWTGHGLALDAGEHASALALRQSALRAEPSVTAALRASAAATGQELVGIGDAVKGAESLSRKVADPRERRSRTLQEVLTEVNDVLRYTVVAPPQGYRAGADAVVADLSARGFTLVALSNRWTRSSPYSGINSTWRDPASGMLLEVQLHTPESWAANKATRVEYEERREPMTTPERKQQLVEREREVWGQVPTPPDAADLTPQRYGLRPVSWRASLDALVPAQPTPEHTPEPTPVPPPPSRPAVVRA